MMNEEPGTANDFRSSFGLQISPPFSAVVEVASNPMFRPLWSMNGETSWLVSRSLSRSSPLCSCCMASPRVPGPTRSSSPWTAWTRPSSRSDFGYQIDTFTVNRRVIIQIILTEDAAKSFGSGRLKLTKAGETVVETTLGLDDGGARRGLLKITLDPRAIDGGELVIFSGEIKGQPALTDFGGFRLSIQTLLRGGEEGGGQDGRRFTAWAGGAGGATLRKYSRRPASVSRPWNPNTTCA